MNVFASKGQRVSVEDFLPRWEKPPDPAEQMESQIALLRRAAKPKDAS